MADESYIRELSSALKDRIRADAEQTKKDNRNAEILKAESPKQWFALKTWLKEAAGQLNTGVASQVITLVEGHNPDEMKIHCAVGQNRGDVEVKFFDVLDGGQISAKGNGFDGCFDAAIDGRAVYWTTRKGERLTIEGVGKSILEAGLKL